MSLQELHIDYDYYQQETSLEDLKEAANKLSIAAQEQFDEIKNEKWFTRVFDMVTLSTKKDQRMASQIGELSQAQTIFMEILVRLSTNDRRISELVTTSMEKIKRLSQQDLLLAKKVKELENYCVLGLTKQTDIVDLPMKEKQIAGGLLLHLMDQFEHVSEHQQAYANAVLNYIEVDPQPIDIHQAIYSLNNIDSKKILLQCCIEYGFLQHFNFDFLEGIEELLEEFDFGNKTIKELVSKVENLYKLRGEDGFIDKYGGYDFLEPDETFYAELEDAEAQYEMIEKEDVVISTILHIPSGTVQEFHNKNIYINTYIRCEGTLRFENCSVYYNESEEANEIIVEEGAELEFLNCAIFCKGEVDNFFIQTKENSELLFQNCEFYGCSYFANLEYNGSITIEKSKLINPSENFLSGQYNKGTIQNCAITFTTIPKSSTKENEYSWKPVFNVNTFSEEPRFVIQECVVNGDALTYSSTTPSLIIFDIEKGVYQNCSFEFLNNCIRNAKEVVQSEFTNCGSVLTLGGLFSLEEIKLTNSLFMKCESVVEASHSSIISNCQFIDCTNNIIKTDFDGGVTIEYCEFDNVTYTNGSSFISEGSLYFQRTKNKSSTFSTVKKCVFNGFETESGFLILGNVFEKIKGPTAFIEDCTFQNCVTKRDSGKIIKQYSSYFGLFNKEIEVEAIAIRNCRGLDKINKENGYTEDVIIKGETPTGAKIGASIVAGTSIGLSPIGLIAAGIIKHVTTDTDRHVE
ncbi:hypothetical protein [Bacillus sp. REN16]|uniref:hypothetical protein n=1 Tax=Bacillus sp. REN16 TaxID=2887296 RepID=UPI001E5F4842|nr:hypothetical protein [Bacillus sp. REN16]MCC3356929.1 hypothetical protein [Bacillus sp. REN16]